MPHKKLIQNNPHAPVSVSSVSAQHRAARPAQIVPDPGRMKLKDMNVKAKQKGREGTAFFITLKLSLSLSSSEGSLETYTTLTG